MSYNSTGEEWPTGSHARARHPSQIAAAAVADALTPVTDKIKDVLDPGDRKGSLPMYKEKPYHYPPSERRSQILKKRRNWLGLGIVVLLLLYWQGAFSTSTSSKTTPTKASKGRGKSKATSAIEWDARREKVKDVFKTSWAAYEKYAWGYDEYHPLSKNGRQMVPGGMGWIIVDALDTLMLMNMTTELTKAREWMSTSLSYDKDHDINTFETTIRMLGGLLSAHYLSDEFPNMAPVKDKLGADIYLEKAVDLADRLSYAYTSKSGIPFASINPYKRAGIASHADGGASSTAEATTTQLEMKYLSKLTGEPIYWEKAEKVMQVVDDLGAKDGLLPIFLDPTRGTFHGNNIRLGSRGDSYYEYLIKQYLQTSQDEVIYLDMWDQALIGIYKHLVTYTKHANLTIIGERPNGLEGALFPKMDHLVCFMPGTIALAATNGKPLKEAKKTSMWHAPHETDMEFAKELMKTCWGMYKATKTGLAPEIAHFHLHDPPLMGSEQVGFEAPNSTGDDLPNDPDAAWRKDFDIHANDRHNLQRPETVESLFYMWRITGDVKYREWGWEMFESFAQHTAMPDDSGFGSIKDVESVPTSGRDNMESFWFVSFSVHFLFCQLFNLGELPCSCIFEGLSHYLTNADHTFLRCRPKR